MKLNARISLVPKFRRGGAVPPPPHTSWRCGAAFLARPHVCHGNKVAAASQRTTTRSPHVTSNPPPLVSCLSASDRSWKEQPLVFRLTSSSSSRFFPYCVLCFVAESRDNHPRFMFSVFWVQISDRRRRIFLFFSQYIQKNAGILRPTLRHGLFLLHPYLFMVLCIASN
jgi:hypothetical protein